ncbi:hypothetical protein E2C01_078553 [Portunus trituberculatus]|uniref:Uncharacterized protein n=1 Tax=Portunus trituberculatus TaxID=210409 RepID=A0A5B7IUF4_PORTR|nr:hypothetical protein [Portunus trituberculatus]
MHCRSSSSSSSSSSAQPRRPRYMSAQFCTSSSPFPPSPSSPLSSLFPSPPIAASPVHPSPAPTPPQALSVSIYHLLFSMQRKATLAASCQNNNLRTLLWAADHLHASISPFDPPPTLNLESLCTCNWAKRRVSTAPLLMVRVMLHNVKHFCQHLHYIQQAPGQVALVPEINQTPT